MTTILLTGIPKVGKSDLIDKTVQLSENLPGSITTISVGDIIYEEARKRWGTTRRRMPHISLSNQMTLRSYVISEVCSRLRETRSEHVIIDTPMTLYFEGTIPNIVFDYEQIDAINRAAEGIDAVVTLIDSPENIAPNFENTKYPTDHNLIFNWIASEVDVTAAVSPSKHEGNEYVTYVRKLVIPKENSDTTLAKLLEEPWTPICYLSYPITNLREDNNKSPATLEEKREANRRIEEFKQAMQSYSAVIVPIGMSENGELDDTEIMNTVHRNLNWFIRRSNIVIGFYPIDVNSLGVPEELREAYKTGKPIVLIHPEDKHRDRAFGLRPDLYIESEQQFFAELKKPDPKKLQEYLASKLLRDGQPRYQHLKL